MQNAIEKVDPEMRLLLWSRPPEKTFIKTRSVGSDIWKTRTMQARGSVDQETSRAISSIEARRRNRKEQNSEGRRSCKRERAKGGKKKGVEASKRKKKAGRNAKSDPADESKTQPKSRPGPGATDPQTVKGTTRDLEGATADGAPTTTSMTNLITGLLEQNIKVADTYVQFFRGRVRDDDEAERTERGIENILKRKPTAQGGGKRKKAAQPRMAITRNLWKRLARGFWRGFLSCFSL